MIATLLGKKIGMTQVYDAQNVLVPVTVVEAGPCPVVQVKSYNGDIHVDSDNNPKIAYAGPLAVLVDRFSASASDCSFFSSAMAEATCCLALASCPFMSTISWLSIFSGFSAREMRSLMFDRIKVDKRSKSPMGRHLSR